MDLHLITMFVDAKTNWLHNIGLSSASCEKEHLMCFIFKILRFFFSPLLLQCPVHLIRTWFSVQLRCQPLLSAGFRNTPTSVVSPS